MLAWGLFLFLGQKTANKVPVAFLSVSREKWDNEAMEQILKDLEKLGVSEQTIATIRAAGDCKEARAYALLIKAMYDDRHEYV